MIWNAVIDPWLWLGAAGFFSILLGIIVYKQRHPSSQKAARADADKWVPTGRIDFQGPTDCDPDTAASFQLQAEETRTVYSVGGLAHHEIRWRRATLNEAKKVVRAYHEVRNPGAPAPEAGSGPGSPAKRMPLECRSRNQASDDVGAVSIPSRH